MGVFTPPLQISPPLRIPRHGSPPPAPHDQKRAELQERYKVANFFRRVTEPPGRWRPVKVLAVMGPGFLHRSQSLLRIVQHLLRKNYR